MGFMSWLTCDKETSIANIYADLGTKPVYLLQPNGKPSIKEAAYEGYGIFDGVNAYYWLGKENAHALGIDISDWEEKAIVMLGVALEVGHVMRDTETGDIWHVFNDQRDVVPGHFFDGTYADVIPELGASANDLAESGKFRREMIHDIIGMPYPLKFSHSPSAIYEDLPLSKICPDQGYFYD